MRTTALSHLVGKQRRVNPTEHDKRATCTNGLADLIAAEGIAGVDADTDDIALGDEVGIEQLEAFVDENRGAVSFRRGCGEHKQPPGGDDRHSKGNVAGIDKIHAHRAADLLPVPL